MPPKDTNARNRLLDAAETLVAQQGVRELTLDAVAALAGLSKGGLLYHFPSKDDLVRGMVKRIAEELSADFDRCVDAEPPGNGRLTRAMLRLNTRVEADPSQADRYTRVSAVILSTIVHGQELMEPIRAFYRQTMERLATDGLPPGRAEILAAAFDGLWLGSMFGLYELKPERLAAIANEMRRLAEAEG